MLNNKKIFMMVVICIFSGPIFCAENIVVQQDKIVALEFLKKLDEPYDFSVAKKVSLPGGQVRYKLLEYYKDLFVWNTGVVTTIEKVKDLTAKELIFGNFLVKIEHDVLSVEPRISKETAIEVATQEYRMQNIAIQNLNIELIIKTYDKVAKLTYLIDFFVDASTIKRPFYIIDANTGRILEQWEGLPSSPYPERCGVQNAALTLEYSIEDVRMAFKSVGVEAECTEIKSDMAITY